MTASEICMTLAVSLAIGGFVTWFAWDEFDPWACTLVGTAAAIPVALFCAALSLGLWSSGPRTPMEECMGTSDRSVVRLACIEKLYGPAATVAR